LGSSKSRRRRVLPGEILRELADEEQLAFVVREEVGAHCGVSVTVSPLRLLFVVSRPLSGVRCQPSAGDRNVVFLLGGRRTADC
jgi:hypothetical protein